MSDNTILVAIIGGALGFGGAYLYFTRRVGAGTPSLGAQTNMARMGRENRRYM